MGDTAGYIKLWRRCLDHELLANDNTAFVVFVKLLMRVDRTTGKVVTGRFKLAELTNLKGTTIYDALKRLEKAGMVVMSADNKKTTIYICNWSKWQGSTDSTTDNRPTTNRQQTVTIQEVRSKKKEVVPKGTTATKRREDIDRMFAYWADATGVPISSKQQANRYACSNLLKRFAEPELTRLINGVAAAQEDRYAPRISDFVGLQAKLSDLLTWGKQKGRSNANVTIID